MNLRLLILAAVALCVLADGRPALAKGKSGGGGGTVQVRGYYRKNGTYVAPHTRSAPGSGGGSSDDSGIYVRTEARTEAPMEARTAAPEAREDEAQKAELEAARKAEEAERKAKEKSEREAATLKAALAKMAAEKALAEDPERQERQARTQLAMVKILLDKRTPDANKAAKRRLEDLIRKFPKTKAAQEAEKLLWTIP